MGKQYLSQNTKKKIFGTNNKFIESRGVKKSCQRDLIVSGNFSLGIEVEKRLISYKLSFGSEFSVIHFLNCVQERFRGKKNKTKNFARVTVSVVIQLKSEVL